MHTAKHVLEIKHFGYWADISKQRAFLDDLATKLNITDKARWYNISPSAVKRYGGSALLQKYGSMNTLLTAIYTEYPQAFLHFIVYSYKWDFPVTRGHWDLISNQKSFLIKLAKKLNIDSVEDWYSVPVQEFQQHGGGGLLGKYSSSPSKLLAAVFPEYKQAGRNFVMNIVNELKLTNVEDILHVPIQYHTITV